ncbi:RNA methyltransferase [Occultella glacieicola]|uniref:RNA methyltransferase n=1 Tax=Occultella glacieicola TaxID=2518684 RepID=A0ABY2E2F8_9MICO|nr:RNA methyltransferase [Occultella glacieicola]TDE90857.1 RNA methyltransferase [Occultella glacieicola]
MMPDPDLTNPRAERVKAVRGLAGRSARSRHGQFLAEGPQTVREAVAFAAEHVRDVYLTPQAAERYPEIVDAAHIAGLYLHLGSPEVLDAMSPDAQGVLAVLNTWDTPLASVLAADPAPRLIALLSQVRDPGNAGTVIRAADAAGADAVILTSASVDAHNPKVVRATAGSLFHVPVVTGLTLDDAVTAARAAGMQILAADGAGAVDLDELAESPRSGADGAGGADLAAPTVWVFGNEAWGLGAPERALADAVVRIPIRGRAESLNLAMAATLCLYASGRAPRHRRPWEPTEW